MKENSLYELYRYIKLVRVLVTEKIKQKNILIEKIILFEIENVFRLSSFLLNKLIKQSEEI